MLEVLRDPILKGESDQGNQYEKLRAVYYKMFDETELSKSNSCRATGKLTPAQQEEFVRLFHQILENT